MKKKMLWIGDAACGSGFGRASHYILGVLHRTWDVTVLGVNYTGDPHNEPYPIYPCWPGGDSLGVKRLKGAEGLLQKVKPDLVVIQSNPWHFPVFAKHIPDTIPIVGIVAVEGKNCQGFQLNSLSRAIFWTEFGRQEAIDGGMTVPSAVIPLGVDLDIYTPGDRRRARTQLGLPEKCMDAFIVGNVNRNQYRKRLDLTIQFFARWIRSRGIEDAYLSLHALAGSTVQVDCEALARYHGRDGDHPHGVQDRLIAYEAENQFQGFHESQVAAIYRSLDVQISTSLGEGFGLTMLEGMASGVAQIGGDYSAYGEWARRAAYLVPCPQEGLMPDVHVQIGGTPDEGETIRALDLLYHDRSARECYRTRGLELASRPEYRWENIGSRFAEQMELAVSHVIRSAAQRC